MMTSQEQAEAADLAAVGERNAYLKDWYAGKLRPEDWPAPKPDDPRGPTIKRPAVQWVESLPGDDSVPVYRMPRADDFFPAPKPDDVDYPADHFGDLGGRP